MMTRLVKLVKEKAPSRSSRVEIARWFSNLEPEVQKLIHELSIDRNGGIDIRDPETRDDLTNSNQLVREAKQKTELLLALGLQKFQKNDKASSTEEGNENSGPKRHKLPCGHYPLEVANAARQAVRGKRQSEALIHEQDVPHKYIPGRSTEEVYRGYYARRHESVSCAPVERLDELDGDSSSLCHTCIYRRYQERFYFTMQNVSHDAFLLSWSADDEDPEDHALMDTDRMVDYKFATVAPTKGEKPITIGGTVPYLIWELWDNQKWDYIQAIGRLLNRPGYLPDSEAPPEREEMDPELVDGETLKRTTRPTPDFTTLEGGNIRGQYNVSVSLTSRSKREKKVTWAWIEPRHPFPDFVQLPDLTPEPTATGVPQSFCRPRRGTSLSPPPLSPLHPHAVEPDPSLPFLGATTLPTSSAPGGEHFLPLAGFETDLRTFSSHAAHPLAGYEPEQNAPYPMDPLRTVPRLGASLPVDAGSKYRGSDVEKPLQYGESATSLASPVLLQDFIDSFPAPPPAPRGRMVDLYRRGAIDSPPAAVAAAPEKSWRGRGRANAIQRPEASPEKLRAENGGERAVGIKERDSAEDLWLAAARDLGVEQVEEDEEGDGFSCVEFAM